MFCFLLLDCPRGKEKKKLDLHEIDFYAFISFPSPSPSFLYSLMAPRPFSKQSQQAVNTDQHQSSKTQSLKYFLEYSRVGIVLGPLSEKLPALLPATSEAHSRVLLPRSVFTRSLFLSQLWLLRRAHCQPWSGHQCPPGLRTTGFCMRNSSCRFLKTFSLPVGSGTVSGFPGPASGTIEHFDRCAFHPLRSFPSTDTQQTTRGVVMTFLPDPPEQS